MARASGISACWRSRRIATFPNRGPSSVGRTAARHELTGRDELIAMQSDEIGNFVEAIEPAPAVAAFDPLLDRSKIR